MTDPNATHAGGENDPPIVTLAQALVDLRDSWMYVSLALKDHMANTPSSAQDEVAVLVERTLDGIQARTRGNLE